MIAKAFAPAKINLTLHVTGQRTDGYHLLDSLVIFTDIGDRVAVSPSLQTRLVVSGPMANGVPTDRRNLVVQAAELMGISAKIHLEKHLPAAAGLGGGSSDAAATLLALSRMAGQPVPELDKVIGLGADVPLCLSRGLIRMRGIGDKLERLSATPDLSLILINPGIAVPTGAVFGNLQRRDFAPMPAEVPDFSQVGWLDWLSVQRNDLEAPAIAAAPAIGQILQILRQSEGCLLARMSGSGATCFAIMQDDLTKDRVATQLRQEFPRAWVMPCNGLQGMPS